MQIPRVGVPDVGHCDPSLFQEKCLSGEILPSSGSLQWGVVCFGETMSLTLPPISMSSFYLLLWGAVHLVFKSFPEGNDPYGAVDVV